MTMGVFKSCWFPKFYIFMTFLFLMMLIGKINT
jgi:hypothetical protein